METAGIVNPDEHFEGKTIRVKGSINEADQMTPVQTDDVKQLAVVEQGVAPEST